VARAIVRFSLNRDINGPNTNAIRKALESHGIANIGTSVYEGYADMKNVTDALRQTLDVIDNLTGHATLDHLWVYVDPRGEV
jgi:hypothetical protein